MAQWPWLASLIVLVGAELSIIPNLRLRDANATIQFSMADQAYITKEAGRVLRVNNSLIVTDKLTVGGKVIDWERVEVMEATATSHGNTISSHGSTISSHGSTISSHGNTLSTHASNIASHTTDLGEHQSAISALNATQKAQQATIDGMGSHAAMTSLQALVQGHATTISSHTNSLNSHGSSIASHANSIASHATDIFGDDPEGSRLVHIAALHNYLSGLL